MGPSYANLFVGFIEEQLLSPLTIGGLNLTSRQPSWKMANKRILINERKKKRKNINCPW